MVWPTICKTDDKDKSNEGEGEVLYVCSSSGSSIRYYSYGFYLDFFYVT